jgi:hypothetical protein
MAGFLRGRRHAPLILEPAVTQHEHAIETIEDLFVVGDRNDGAWPPSSETTARLEKKGRLCRRERFDPCQQSVPPSCPNPDVPPSIFVRAQCAATPNAEVCRSAADASPDLMRINVPVLRERAALHSREPPAMLPFTSDEFFSVFAAYNIAIWPVQLAAYVIAAMALWLIFARRPAAGRVAGGVLALFLAMGWHRLPPALLFQDQPRRFHFWSRIHSARLAVLRLWRRLRPTGIAL